MLLRPGRGGWCRVDGGLGLPGRVYARMTQVDGQLRMTELYIDGRGEAIPPAALRKFPTAMLEQWVTSIRDRPDEFRWGRLVDAVGPDLSRLAAFFARGVTAREESLPKTRRNWVVDSFLAQTGGSRPPRYPFDSWNGEDDEDAGEIDLELPEDGRLTDEFLSDVARAYDTAIARRESPAVAIGRAVDVSPRTVHRWVYTARKRGIMPPAATKGRIV